MKKYISVFIPVYNGEKYLKESIDAILSQKLPQGYELELLITDSGSTDNSIEILKSYKKSIFLRQIPNTEFGHGKTRQQAVDNAKGEYVLFLSQDATPMNDRWIINMIEPFLLNENIGCVFGRQVPRPTAIPTIKREVATVFANLSSPDTIAVHRYKSMVDQVNTNAINTFFSDVNSAVKRSLFIKKSISFRDVAYAEDQALAEDMLELGYYKAYTPIGSVWHSNEYTIGEFCKRKFDEYLGLINNIGYTVTPSKRALLFGWIKPTLSDWQFIKKDGDYTRKRKLKNYALCIGYNFAVQLGKYRAGKYHDNQDKIDSYSLERSHKNKHRS